MGGRESALAHTVSEAEQKSGKTLIDRMMGRQGIGRFQIPAHQSEKLFLQVGDAPGHFAQLVKGQAAYQGGVQCQRGALMAAAVNGIHPDQFPRQMESQDLFLTVFSINVRFYAAGTHGIEGHEGLPLVEKVIASMQGAYGFHHAVEKFEILGRHADGEAQILQRASAASLPQAIDIQGTGSFLRCH